MAITFKCPQCVAASLTSKVAFVWPLKSLDGNLIYFDETGTLHMDNNLGNIAIYMCTKNHVGPVTAPSGL